MASVLEYVSSDWVAVEVCAVAGVSSDWVAVEVSAVAGVSSECACGRESSVPSLGRELIRGARLRGVDMPRRGWRQGRSWRGGHTRPLGNEDLRADAAWLAFVL